MTPEDNEVIANLPGDIRAVTTSLTSHTSATSEAHAASAISYGTGTVKKALDTAAGHQANQNNPHGVTAAQAGAVALDDAVMTVTADKIVKRTSTGKVAGDITGNAATATKATTATTAESISAGGHSFTPSWDGTEIKFQVDSTVDVPVHNSMLLQGMTPAQITSNTASYFMASTQASLTPSWSASGSYTLKETQLNVKSGLAAGTYSVQTALQYLINLSHSHGATSFSYSNCCSCGGE